MAYTYASFQQALALEMVVPNANVNEPNFVAILPTIIDYAEQRLYRELDLLAGTLLQVVPTTANLRLFDLSQAPVYILAIERMRVLLPAGSTALNYTSAPPLTPVSVDYLDAVFSGAAPGAPVHFGMQSDTLAVLGPTPDAVYNIEVSAEIRPIPLYSTPPNDGTQSTFLTRVLPDLFLAAAMVAAAGYRKNYGAQGDDPRMAVSWQSQYDMLLASAKTEEIRKRFLGWNMMSSSSPPIPSAAAPSPG